MYAIDSVLVRPHALDRGCAYACLFSLPTSKQASRAQILKKAAEYIQFMRKKNNNVQSDIDEIAKQNKMLEDQSKWGLGFLLFKLCTDIFFYSLIQFDEWKRRKTVEVASAVEA